MALPIAKLTSEVTTQVSAAASGDNLAGHVVTAASVGYALSGFAVWILQLVHLDPPAAVAQGITTLSMLAASFIMKKING